jgi:hypothetical protein
MKTRFIWQKNNSLHPLFVDSLLMFWNGAERRMKGTLRSADCSGDYGNMEDSTITSCLRCLLVIFILIVFNFKSSYKYFVSIPVYQN